MTPRLWKLEYNEINHRGNVIASDGFLFEIHILILFANDVIDALEGH